MSNLEELNKSQDITIQLPSRRNNYAYENFVEAFKRYINSSINKTSKDAQRDYKKIKDSEFFSRILLNEKFILRSEQKTIVDQSQIDLPIGSDQNAGKDTNSQVFEYYPYIFPSASERPPWAFQRDNTWNKFKTAVRAIAHLQDPNIVDSIMESVGPEFFHVYDYNGLKGKLGELQAALVFGTLLYSKTSGVADATRIIRISATELEAGDLRNSKFLGADVLIKNQYGIQVKNWTPNQENQNAYKQFSDTLEWTTFKSYLQDAPDLEEFDKFLSILAFNRVARTPPGYLEDQDEDDIEKFNMYKEGYRTFYNRMKAPTSPMHSAFNSLLAANLNAFMALEGSYFDEIGQKQNYQNIFYLISGDTIVPVSNILNVLIKRIRTIVENLRNKQASARQFFNFS